VQLLRAEDGLAQLLAQVIREQCPLDGADAVPPIIFDVPKHMEFGDLTTNIAMRLAPQLKQPPVKVAESLIAAARQRLGAVGLEGVVDRLDVKPPGFINIAFSHQGLVGELQAIRREREGYGAVPLGSGKRMLIEFVSSNPTGPLSIAHGRQAAFGDALARVAAFCGYQAAREYYVNDEGRQITLLGRSIEARCRQLRGEAAEVPEDGYRGEYLLDVAKRLPAEAASWLSAADGTLRFARFGIEEMLRETKEDLERFGVRFDTWFEQSGLMRSGRLTSALDRLKQQGLLFEDEGAWWFRSTAFGDDKDRVVIKQGGEYTYLSSDIAYHQEKYERGFDQIIDIWGPDHHGYIARVRASIEALGHDPARFHVLIVQLTTLFRDGQPVRMSTRAGELVTLKELVDEVGVDAARFFFLMRKADSHLDFDLKLATEQSPENPVYYIQYAHARIASIMRFSRNASSQSHGQQPSDVVEAPRLELLQAVEEQELMRLLCRFPHVVRGACRALEPYYVTAYLQELAASFHRFYTRHRVVTDDVARTAARLVLIDALRVVLANGLGLLGVGVPERMGRADEQPEPQAADGR